MDAVTEKVLANAPQPASQSAPEPEGEGEGEGEGEVVRTTTISLKVSYIKREDGIIECAIGTKATEAADIGYGANPREALRRALKRNAALVARSAPKVRL